MESIDELIKRLHIDCDRIERNPEWDQTVVVTLDDLRTLLYYVEELNELKRVQRLEPEILSGVGL